MGAQGVHNCTVLRGGDIEAAGGYGPSQNALNNDCSWMFI